MARIEGAGRKEAAAGLHAIPAGIDVSRQLWLAVAAGRLEVHRLMRQRVLIPKERMTIGELRALVAVKMEGFEMRQAERERRREMARPARMTIEEIENLVLFDAGAIER